MQWDAEDASGRAKHRDEQLREDARRELGVYTPFYRRRLREAGVDPRRVRGLEDLNRIRPVTWADVAEDPAAFLAQPRERDLARTAERRVVAEIALARVLRGRRERVNREVVEPRYKPVLWTLAAGVPVGWTETDLEQLGEVGARMFSVVGLDRHDVLVDLTDPGAQLAHWQVVLGARHALLPTLHLGPSPAPDVVAAAAPAALAGSARALLETLAALADRGAALPGLRAVIVAGEDPGGGLRYALAAAAAEVSGAEPAVVAVWAPPGARALWVECPGGPGFHTYPDVEFLEVARSAAVHPDGPGELIWTGLGWRGTVLFRLLTGARAELVDEECEACGRRGPIVLTGSGEALDVVRLLDDRAELSDYLVEFRRVNGADELIVYLALHRGADAEALVHELDRDLAATQYVVLPKRSVTARLKASGSRVVDAR